MVQIALRSQPLLVTLQLQIQQQPTVISERGRSKEFRLNIHVLLIRGYKLNVDLPGTK